MDLNIKNNDYFESKNLEKNQSYNCYIFKFDNSINEDICIDIIEKFEDFSLNNDSFSIPKNDIQWFKIERFLFKEILNKIKIYRNNISNFSNIKINNDIILNISNDIITNNFNIYKYNCFSNDRFYSSKDSMPYLFLKRENNRYNVLTYIFFLNYSDSFCFIKFDNGLIIEPKKGMLLIFPDDFNFTYKFFLPKFENQYIIYGNLYSKLV